jgi:hypothetical protein
LNNGRDFDIQLFSAQGFFQNMTLSRDHGNGTAYRIAVHTNGALYRWPALLTQRRKSCWLPRRG